ncbi:MAG: 30S ribosomal protein S18 [Candidatus Terrybacteria bacterium RIFCSPLOWO2_01_FULL_58_14]|uniref:Small ribosomal subunit protein bS18 n=2 Tax=Candidatus Terryibacteriota TaxID=1817920 RepID=A0A1G2PVN3_9BACT|nr:MAG: 30S ribosomal protein S18 [Candidatus Terrybacteria bacterium RIFCSPHIGHO2_01_FULL_58_15]OHA52388.1 MAG: 30S ribosomal protein S18 [Candidatus Terrybacteria bacterium RIFCSPLOWO2_01_FULL_58_14]
MRIVPENCYFCTKNLRDIDYKDVDVLQRFVSAQAKILPPRKTGVCAKHQRQLSRAIKRARFLALIPFTTR